jgi:hypothetical protein
MYFDFNFFVTIGKNNIEKTLFMSKTSKHYFEGIREVPPKSHFSNVEVGLSAKQNKSTLPHLRLSCSMIKLVKLS